MNKRSAQWLLRLAAVSITLALLIWLVSSARWQDVGERLLQLDWRTFVVAGLLFSVSYLLRAARIFDEFRQETRALPSASIGFASLHFARFLRLTLIHNALVNVAPLRSGELAFPILLKRWFGVATERSVVALLWLRMQDALVVLALAALVWPGLSFPQRSLALLAVVGIGAGVPLWTKRRATRTESRPDTGNAQHGASGWFSTMSARLRSALAQSTRSNARSWLWTLANWSIKIGAETWLLMRLLSVPPGTASLGALGAELAAILPIQGIAGFGTFEAGAAAFMRTYNVPVADGLQAALALHLIMLAFAVAAGGLAVTLLPGEESDGT